MHMNIYLITPFISDQCLYLWLVKVHTFLFIEYMFSSSKLTSSAKTRSRCVSFNFILSSCSWTILITYYKVEMKCNGDNSSTCYRLFWRGNLSQKFVLLWTLLSTHFKQHSSFHGNCTVNEYIIWNPLLIKS